ncbi:PIN domain-containing protein [Candidatus Uhrbacteria bacterium]|nr:PIN domain-containing protein [Candidatus Uhrbacteria bacterium]
MDSMIDTNVLIRFFVGDNKKQKEQAIVWFKEATKGERTIIITPIVVAETVFVLESFYKHSRKDIMASLLPFLAMPVLKVEERDLLLNLWEEYLNGLHFVDAYLLTSARRQSQELLTFDKQLLKRLQSQ